MLVLGGIGVLVVVGALLFSATRTPPIGAADLVKVKVSKDLPATISNAVLSLVMIRPPNASPSTYGAKNSLRCSLESPGGSSSDGYHFQEERLIAIRSEGFVVLFTERAGTNVQTNAVLFHYGETNETNVLGWKVTGRFK